MCVSKIQVRLRLHLFVRLLIQCFGAVCLATAWRSPNATSAVPPELPLYYPLVIGVACNETIISGFHSADYLVKSRRSFIGNASDRCCQNATCHVDENVSPDSAHIHYVGLHFTESKNTTHIHITYLLYPMGT